MRVASLVVTCLVGCVGSVDGGPQSQASDTAPVDDGAPRVVPGEPSPGDGDADAGSPTSGDGDQAQGDDADTSPGDTASADGDGSYFGDSRCTGQSFVLCDDFERATATGALWTTDNNNGGSVAIDTTRAARGTSSVHMRIGADPGSQALLVETSTFPMPDNAFFGRVFIYMSSPAPHGAILRSVGTLPGKTITVELGLNDGPTFFPLYQVSTGGEYGVWPDSYPALPTDRWTCFEWQYDAAGNAMRYWLDDSELTAVETGPAEDPPWTPPTYNSFAFGMAIAHPEDAATQFDAWYDALALDAERIGCAR